MKKIILWFAGVLSGIGLIIGGYTVYAAPSQFGCAAKTSTGTTTPSFITPGNATTTLLYDTQQISGTNQTGCSYQIANWKTDSASLLIQFHASSSPASVLKYRFLFSDDGQDYYSENEVSNINATTSISVGSFKENIWTQVASTTEVSTITGSGLATTSQASRLINLPTPLRYTKVLFYVPPATGLATSTNVSVYAKVVPVKQAEIR